MKGPRISVIVAVYRSENYLSRCVMSILQQTYTNLEILLVDDGSPDKCPQICDNFAAMDTRIKVLHKENGGAYSAWNAGLERMTGDYVSFIDCDDFVSKDYIKYLLYMSLKYHCEISSCSLVYGVEQDFCHVRSKGTIHILDKTEAFLSRKVKAHLYGRLYKATLFKEIRARDVFYVDEDLTYKLFYKAKKTAFTDKKMYYYFQSPNSMTRNDRHWISTDFMEILEDRIQFFDDKEEELLELSWEYYCIALMLIYMKCRRDPLNQNNREEFRDAFLRAYQRVMQNHITPRRDKLMLTLFFMAPRLCSDLVNRLPLRRGA